MFLDLIVSVQALTADPSDPDKEVYTTIPGFEAIPMNLQSASAELTAITNEAYGTVFKGFTPKQGIKIGHRITVSGTNDLYIVKGTSDRKSVV